jgi:hypothetical protein
MTLRKSLPQALTATLSARALAKPNSARRRALREQGLRQT